MSLRALKSRGVRKCEGASRLRGPLSALKNKERGREGEGPQALRRTSLEPTVQFPELRMALGRGATSFIA